MASSGAQAWIEWADTALLALGDAPAPGARASTGPLAAAISSLRRWMPRPGSASAARWEAEVDPDELEYLANAFYNLDTRLSDEARRAIPVAPDEGRTFYLVLVRAILHALESTGPARAAFVDQLRSSWPVAAEAA